MVKLVRKECLHIAYVYTKYMGYDNVGKEGAWPE